MSTYCKAAEAASYTYLVKYAPLTSQEVESNFMQAGRQRVIKQWIMGFFLGSTCNQGQFISCFIVANTISIHQQICPAYCQIYLKAHFSQSA
jgi:hypothetical protein